MIKDILILGGGMTVADRRHELYSPPGEYSQGIGRIEMLAAIEIEKHDLSFMDKDETTWQVRYSLHNHHARVANVMQRMGEVRRRPQLLIDLGRVSALFHDLGKLDDECRLYRANRKLSAEEKEAVDKHALRSGERISEMLEFVRPEDWNFLWQVHMIVVNHHKPYLIPSLPLREIGYDLTLADIFVSIQEDRERAGLGLGEAVSFIKLLELEERDSGHLECLGEIWQSKLTIIDLYGLNLEEK